MILTAKEYLIAVRKANLELRSKEEELKEYQVNCYSISAIDYSKSRVSGGMSTDISDKIIKLHDMVDAVNKRFFHLIDLRSEANQLINKMLESDLRVLLTQRYIFGKSWKEVAAFLHVSEDHARGYMHRDALKAFSKVNTK